MYAKEDYNDFTFFGFALLVSNKKSLSEIEETRSNSSEEPVQKREWCSFEGKSKPRG